MLVERSIAQSSALRRQRAERQVVGPLARRRSSRVHAAFIFSLPVYRWRPVDSQSLESGTDMAADIALRPARAEREEGCGETAICGVSGMESNPKGQQHETEISRLYLKDSPRRIRPGAQYLRLPIEYSLDIVAVSTNGKNGAVAG